MSHHFQRFLDELGEDTPERDYRWTAAKEEACQWLIDRALPGTGVDVGGTEYLCNVLAASGRHVTCYDLVQPREYAPSVQDDMVNILDHFAPRSLDFITTRHTLEHSVMPLYQLWAYNQLLRDDGQLLVVVPMHCKEWVWFHTHHSVLPQENWLMLFHRAGFNVKEVGAGTWNAARPLFIELRFDLRVASRRMRLKGGAPEKR
jgi:hypothetical protein